MQLDNEGTELVAVDGMQITLPGETILCGYFNDRGSLWGRPPPTQRGKVLKNALDKCSLTCINNRNITRSATRPDNSESVIDLAITKHR